VLPRAGTTTIRSRGDRDRDGGARHYRRPPRARCQRHLRTDAHGDVAGGDRDGDGGAEHADGDDHHDGVGRSGGAFSADPKAANPFPSDRLLDESHVAISGAAQAIVPADPRFDDTRLSGDSRVALGADRLSTFAPMQVVLDAERRRAPSPRARCTSCTPIRRSRRRRSRRRDSPALPAST
jgi:hypothetical protein